MIISIIVASTKNGVIGKDNQLPWKSLPQDMAFFVSKTTGHCILTGKKNYFSIPAPFRPLKNRTNILLTRDPHYVEVGTVIVDTLEKGIDFAKAQGETELFIIGGGIIFEMALQKNLVDRIYLTKVDTILEGDTFFHLPEIFKKKEKLLITQKKDDAHLYAFEIYQCDR